MRNWMIILTVLLWVTGCSKQDNSSPFTGVNQDQARAFNSERSEFETAEDPPITAETHYAAGRMAESHSDFVNATKQYKEALKLDPNHKGSLYRMGVCFSTQKKYPEAVDAWKKYVEATGGDPRGYSNLGFCHELAGQIDQAESAYLRGIAKDPKNVPCRTNYGLMLARLGRTAEATLQLQSVLTPAEVHYNLASVWEHQGRKEQAKQEYRKALDLDPTLLEAQTRLGSLE